MPLQTIGIKTVAIAKLVLPDDIHELAKEPRIADRLISIKRLGLLNEPIVRLSDMKLLAGRDRIAAHIHGGIQEARVKLVECDDDTCIDIEIEENLQRRHDPAEQRELEQRALDRAEARIAGERDGETPRKAGRPKTPRGRAREEIAEAKGVKPESVRRAEYRHRERQNKALVEVAETGVPAPPPTSPIKTLGMDLDAAFLAKVNAIMGYIKEATAKARGAQSALTQLKNAELGYPSARLQRLHEDLHDVTARVAAAIPVSLCPGCKGLHGVQEECAMCVGSGFIVKSQQDGVPENLWLEGDDAMVLYRGEPTRVSEFFEEHGEEPEEPANDNADEQAEAADDFFGDFG